MDIHIITIFPEFFEQAKDFGIFRIAIKEKLINFNIHNLRDYTTDRHKTTDDSPYGGGAGMVMKIEPVAKAIKSIEEENGPSYKILITPQGKTLNAQVTEFLSKKGSIMLIPAHYEGIDERVEKSVDMELSIGDYVLSGGEIPSLVILDATVRLIPGVLGNESSLNEESFSQLLLEYPQYTRPETFEEEKVPEVLLSGNHEKIRQWRLKESMRRTLIKRPDLLLQKEFNREELKILRELREEINKVIEDIEKG